MDQKGQLLIQCYTCDIYKDEYKRWKFYLHLSSWQERRRIYAFIHCMCYMTPFHASCKWNLAKVFHFNERSFIIVSKVYELYEASWFHFILQKNWNAILFWQIKHLKYSIMIMISSFQIWCSSLFTYVKNVVE